MIFKKLKILKINLLSLLPLLLIMQIMVLPLPLIIWGKTAFKKDRSLIGVANTVLTLPAISGSSLLAKKWQKQFEDWLNLKIPFRIQLIRIHNQIYYSLFSSSYTFDDRIVIGKKNYFYQISYLNKYCNSKHIVYRQAQFDEWAAKLQALNDFFQKRGQKFVYIISPSKASYFPEYFPANYQCNGVHRPDYVLAQHALKNVAFPYVDGSKILLQNKPQYGALLFPLGGIHWTVLGAALIMQDVLKKIAAPQLPKLQFSYTTSFSPNGTDSDLLDLNNLFFPQKYYIVPVVSFTKIPSIYSGKQLKVALVGSSFSMHLVQLFNQEKLFTQMDYYFYFKERHFQVKSDTPPEQVFLDTKNVDLTDPKTYQDILNADVVIFEENENNLQAAYLTQLLDALRINPYVPK